MAAARFDDHRRVCERGRPPYLADAVAASPQLRRDIGNALAAGISPRRYAGWEPSTGCAYDEQGRISHTVPEPEWDELDNALVDALENWQAGVHTCGHHESEQLDPDAVFVAGYTVCKACQALQAAQEKQAKTDKPEREAGHNPDFPRRWRIRTASRAQVSREAAERAARKTPQQRMDEAIAQLEQS